MDDLIAVPADKLSDIADAIRLKTDNHAGMTVDDMPLQIGLIPTGTQQTRIVYTGERISKIADACAWIDSLSLTGISLGIIDNGQAIVNQLTGFLVVNGVGKRISRSNNGWFDDFTHGWSTTSTTTVVINTNTEYKIIEL